jgi:hypothetical protein
MTASEHPVRERHCPVLARSADQRRIGCSRAVVPLEITEFYGVRLAGDRERALSTVAIAQLTVEHLVPGWG